MKISCDCDKCEFKHLEKGLCEEARQEKFKDILNPWKDAEKEKPEEKTEVLVKLSSADGFFHAVGIYRSEFKDWFFYDPELISALKRSIVYILSWMHIPKNEGEE